MLKVAKVPNRNWLVVSDEHKIPPEVFASFDVVVLRVDGQRGFTILKDRRNDLGFMSPELARSEIDNACQRHALVLGGEPVTSEQILHALKDDPSAPKPMTMEQLRVEMATQKQRADNWEATERHTMALLQNVRGVVARVAEMLVASPDDVEAAARRVVRERDEERERADKLAREHLRILTNLGVEAQTIRKALGLDDFSREDPTAALVRFANELHKLREERKAALRALCADPGDDNLVGNAEHALKMKRESFGLAQTAEKMRVELKERLEQVEGEYKRLRDSIDTISDPERAYWHAYARARFGAEEAFNVGEYAPEVWRVVALAVHDARGEKMWTREHLAQFFKGDEE